MPGIYRKGNWNQVQKALAAASSVLATGQAFEKALLKEAYLMQRKMKQAIKTAGESNKQPWAPNAPSTVTIKGSSKPLIDRGDLRNSISVVEHDKMIFIGIPNNARGRNGQDLVSVAATHEFGHTFAIKVTQEMRDAVLIKLAKGDQSKPFSSKGKLVVGNTMIIRLPRRSFVGDTMDAHFSSEDVANRLLKRVALALGGPWAQLAGGAKLKI